MELIFKFIKFGIVGVSGLVIDFSITYLLKERLKINKYVANSLGFTFAAVNNYIWNKVWTFQNTSTEYAYQFSQFIFISIIGLLLNNGVVYLCNQKLHLNFYVAKIIAVMVVFVWNFFMNLLFTFAN